MFCSEIFESVQPVSQTMLKDVVHGSELATDKLSLQAEYTYDKCCRDKDYLITAGLDWSIVNDIPICLAALRLAESTWFKARFCREDAQRNWIARAQEGYTFRGDLLYIMEYAYKKYPDTLSKLQPIKLDGNHVKMIQDLNDISVVGAIDTAPLKAIGFNLNLLDTALQLSNELGLLYSTATMAKERNCAAKLMRDKACEHLRKTLDVLQQFTKEFN